MNKKGNIIVSHVLKIIIRVEKGNADDADGLKMYDIVIQYPIHLLSVSIHVTRRVVILKTDGDSTASVQPEVHFTATVLTYLALRSSSARPIITI